MGDSGFNMASLQQFQAFQQFLRQSAGQGTEDQDTSSAPVFTQQTPSQQPNFPQAQQPSLLSSQIPITQSAPIQTLYQSARTLPAIPNSSISSISQPFLGFSALAPPMASPSASQQVNQARLASAAATLPCQQQVACCGRRRGPAVQAPVLPRGCIRARVDQCLIEPERTSIRVQAPGASHEQIHFIVAGEAFTQALAEADLLYRLELSLTTRVHSLIDNITEAMQASPSQFIFAPLPSRAPRYHLSLLGLLNRGTTRRDGQVRLLPYPVTQELTIGDLASDWLCYGHEKCVDTSNTWIINLAVTRFPLQHIENGRVHSCLWAKIAQLLPSDNKFGEDNGLWCESEDEVSNNVGDSSRPSQGQASSSTCRSLQLARTHTASPEPTVRHTGPVSFATIMISSLPSKIWDCSNPWTPPAETGPLYQIHNFTSSICSAATRGLSRIPRLIVEGGGLDELADKLADLIDKAGKSGDYTTILSPDRSFFRESDTTASYGDGIEEEAPHPLSPAVILFIIYGFEFCCLTPAFISKWFGDLHKTLSDWIATGPLGDISAFASHFISYHESEVGSYQTQDDDTHQALAVDMLFRATLGSTLHRHPEWQAFAAGFALSCLNGFSFTEALRSFQGGPESFISQCGVSQIHSYESLNGFLTFTDEPATLLSGLCSTLCSPTVTYRQLVESFLCGQGLPCPNLFAELQDTRVLHSLVDLLALNTPAFCSKMFVWAATGSPMISVTHCEIMIEAADITELQHTTHRNHLAMSATGCITFQTCFQTVQFAANHVNRLASSLYNPSLEPASFKDAFDHWFLVGNHTLA